MRHLFAAVLLLATLSTSAAALEGITLRSTSCAPSVGANQSAPLAPDDTITVKCVLNFEQHAALCETSANPAAPSRRFVGTIDDGPDIKAAGVEFAVTAQSNSPTPVGLVVALGLPPKSIAVFQGMDLNTGNGIICKAKVTDRRPITPQTSKPTPKTDLPPVDL